MNRTDRLQIIKKVVELHLFPSREVFIEGCILDELMYAGLKTDVEKEFIKVLQTYSFDWYMPSNRIKKYISHYSANPMLASMQHFELNDFVSYFGEYYDGTPTILYRKEGRYEITPIALD